MSTTLTVNGVGYTFPSTGETSWGSNVSSWASAVSTSTLQKTGGTFTLTADVDFGATYGLKATYYKTRSATPATSGQFRLGNTETVSWRSSGDSANHSLALSSDALQYRSTTLATYSSAAPAIVTFGFVSSSADTTSRYSMPGGPYAAADTTERFIPLPYAGYVIGFTVCSTASAAANCVFVVRKNGVDTGLTATLASGSTSGAPAVNTPVIFAKGDRLSIKHTMASASAGPANTVVAVRVVLMSGGYDTPT